MPNSADDLRTHIARFGPFRSEWEGEGSLPPNIPVEFLIGQRTDGRIVFACLSHSIDLIDAVMQDNTPRLEDAHLTLHDRSAVHIEGRYWVVNTNFNSSSGGFAVVIVAILTSVAMYRPEDSRTPTSISFDIVNFLFSGSERVDTVSQGVHSSSMSRLLLHIDGRQLFLDQVQCYDQLEKELQARKDIQVTSTIALDVQDHQGIGDAVVVVDRVCELMTICRGTVVNWIAYRASGPDGSPLRNQLKHSVVKDYSSFELIPHRDHNATRSFLEHAYPRYLDLDQDFQLRRLSRGYAETRGDSFLETRGMLVGVLVEYLSGTRARLDGRETILPSAQYTNGLDPLQSLLVDGLRAVFRTITSEEVQAFTAKLRGFNYRSLRSRITSLCRWIELDPPHDEIDHFVEARNSLAHSGQYPPGLDPVQSFLRMLRLLDTIILRLLGYSGHYIDPVTREVADI
jgi:hypothetical protein